jgi:hypothetical protein
MAAVMEHAAETDDKRAFSEQELVSKLTTENKVSIQNGRFSGRTLLLHVIISNFLIFQVLLATVQNYLIWLLIFYSLIWKGNGQTRCSMLEFPFYIQRFLSRDQLF